MAAQAFFTDPRSGYLALVEIGGWVARGYSAGVADLVAVWLNRSGGGGRSLLDCCAGRLAAVVVAAALQSLVWAGGPATAGQNSAPRWRSYFIGVCYLGHRLIDFGAGVSHPAAIGRNFTLLVGHAG